MGDVLQVTWRGRFADLRPGALGLCRSSLTLIILDGGHPISRCFGESRLRDHEEQPLGPSCTARADPACRPQGRASPGGCGSDRGGPHLSLWGHWTVAGLLQPFVTMITAGPGLLSEMQTVHRAGHSAGAGLGRGRVAAALGPTRASFPFLSAEVAGLVLFLCLPLALHLLPFLGLPRV